MSQETFKWVVEFTVAEMWVADGFDMTDERALDMLSHDLAYANVGAELHARVLTAPKAKDVGKAQGYDSGKHITEQRKKYELPQDRDNPLRDISKVLMHAYRKLDSVAFLSTEGDMEGVKADILHAVGQIANGFQDTGLQK